MATRTYPLPHHLIANERMKSHWSEYVWTGVLLAAAAHFALFSLFPAIRVADVSFTPGELRSVELPPEVKIPPPPAAIARPAMPVVSAEAAVSEDVTIAPTTFEEHPVATLPPPPTGQASAARADRAQFQMFVPTMTAPELRNRGEVSAAILKTYPPLLLEAGIGGTVLLYVWIDERGNTVDAEVIQTSGQKDLDQAAIHVVDIMRFSPARNRDRAVKVIVALPVIYSVR